MRVIYDEPPNKKPVKREKPKFSEIGNQIIVSILDELGRLLNELIEVVETVPLIEIDDGNIKIMVLDKKDYQKQINFFVSNFDKCKDKLLLNLNLSVFEYRYIIINGTLEQIHSYVVMERQGSNITQEKWKQLFREELLWLFRGLCDNVGYVFTKEE